MTTKTVTQVGEQAREWENKKFGGTYYSLPVTFSDGEQGEVTTNLPDRVSEIVESLKALVGKPTEFELQDAGKWPSGDTRPWKIKGYPGKPGQQQDGQRPFGGGTSRQRHDPETNASIEAQVAAKIAGDIAVALIQKAPFDPRSDDWEPTEYVVGAIPRILAAIRDQKSESGSRPPDGPSPTPDSDKAEGEAPGASPSGQEDKEDLGWGTGPMTAKQKAKLNMLYGNAVTKAARAMFPEVSKIGDITETMAAALIEDKE